MRGKESHPLCIWSSLEVSNNNSEENENCENDFGDFVGGPNFLGLRCWCCHCVVSLISMEQFRGE